MAYTVLMIEDDENIRRPVRRFLEKSGFEVAEAGSAREGAAAFHRLRPDVVLLDFALPDGDALQLLPQLKTAAPETPVLILTGHGSIPLAVQSVKEGAEDFLTKPVELKELARRLEQLLAARRPPPSDDDIDPFVGSSEAVRELAREIQLSIRSESPVLLQGETGSGKGVLARWIHNHGPRADGPFVMLNCGGLTKELLESELFGHVRGSFTGAVRDKRGLIEAADGGTLFLDEIGDMDPEVQPKLLTVLDERRYRRLGEIRERRVDLRLLAATNRELGELVRAQRFRPDLYFRVSTLSIRVPPLRERGEDIPELAQVLLRSICTAGAPELSAEAVDALRNYDWLGNFRELRSVLERAVLSNRDGAVEVDDLRFDLALREEPSETATSLAEAEQHVIEAALTAERGHVTRTARRLGVARSTLYEKLKALAIDPADYR